MIVFTLAGSLSTVKDGDQTDVSLQHNILSEKNISNGKITVTKYS